MAIKLTLDGRTIEVKKPELLIDLMIRRGAKVPSVCYHHQLGPIQTCDTCLVDVNGELVRACATTLADGMTIETKSARADAAQREAFDRILGNHLLYCTVCDNNTGIVRFTTRPRCYRSNIRKSRLSPSRTKSTLQTLSTFTIRISVYFAAVAWRRVRTSRSTKHSLSTGKIHIHGCCGTAASRSANQAAYHAVIA